MSSALRKAILCLAASGAVALGCLAPPGAGAISTGGPYSDWNPGFAGFPSNTPDNPRANCESGSLDCVRRTIGEMYRRFHTEVPVCDDNNVFSLTYIRVTEDIEEAVSEGFYPDLYWINHQDAIFARMYFLTYDNFLAGRMELVPPAWRIAFGAGANQEVEGMGNLLLSMSAHVTRDMPFILYHSGLVTKDGVSRQAQHDAYNARLRELYVPVIEEMSHRFDDSMDNYDVPGLIADDDAFFSVLRFWRQQVWQNATRLANAGSDAERREVAADIEEYAVSQALAIQAGTAYLPGEDSSARDVRCAQFGGQRPGYARGAEVARPVAGGPASIDGRRLAVTVLCPDGVGPCVGNLKLRLHRELVGKEPFSIEPGETALIRAGLSRAAVEHVRDRGEASIWALARSKLAPGDAESHRIKVHVRVD